MTVERADIYTRLTDFVVGALEGATSPTEWPWIKGAQAGIPVNVVSGKAYRGINRLILGCAVASGSDRRWATFNQWQNLGAMVRKGEKGMPIAFYGDLYVNANDERVDPGTPGARKILYAKAATVFSADQVDGWNGATVEMPAIATGADSLDEVEAFIGHTGAQIVERGDKAFYHPLFDNIAMPERGRFKDTAEASATVHFYSTLLHELTHWTGAKARCDRDLKGRFGSEAYAMEELVAEMASAFLAADLGLSPLPRADNVAYLANWLAVLKNDKKAIFTASAAAAKAADFLHACQPEAAAVEDDEDAREAA